MHGAWRADIDVKSGPLASIKDLQFMYVLNEGGTMTESSNYDAAPPVPPAYGIWKTIGRNQFEAKYEFYLSADRPDTTGWLPAGRGLFVERITVSDDGARFASTIRYQFFDRQDKPLADSGAATGSGRKLTFDE